MQSAAANFYGSASNAQLQTLKDIHAITENICDRQHYIGVMERGRRSGYFRFCNYSSSSNTSHRHQVVIQAIDRQRNPQQSTTLPYMAV